MSALFEPLSAKQQMVKIGLVCVVLTPMMLVAVFWRHGFMGQHFGAMCNITIIASLGISLSSRTWIQKIK
jgi:hypothetical protein